MRIGSMTIEAITDGECVYPTDIAYLNKNSTDWHEHGHDHWLEPCVQGNILYQLGGYLVTYGDRVVLVDAGVGPKPTFPFVGGAMRGALLARGVEPSDVTDVIFTHLHNDHIGWASVNGKPFFENATYRCDKRDWDFFVSPDYPMPEWEQQFTDVTADPAAIRLAPVADRMEFFEGEASVIPGIEAWEAAGHTPGTTVLKLTDGGESAVLIGDLAHTEPEMYDDNWEFPSHTDMTQALSSVERIRKRLFDANLPFAAAHFAGMRFGRITSNGQGTFGYERLPR